MQPWAQFYAVTGAAAAALLGLLFVAISMNARATLGQGHDTLKGLSEQAFQNYLAVLMVSLLALFPGMSVSTFGLVTILATGVWAIWMLVRLYQAAVRPTLGRRRLAILRRHLSSVIGFGILISAAARMALGWGGDFNLIASAVVVLLFSATVASWDILVGIANRPAVAG